MITTVIRRKQENEPRIQLVHKTQRNNRKITQQEIKPNIENIIEIIEKENKKIDGERGENLTCNIIYKRLKEESI